MALKLIAGNNASTLLAAAISSSATSLTVSDASAFPTVTEGTNFFKLTLIDAATSSNTEIMHVTATSGDTFTIVRAQENTTAQAWSTSDLVYNMMTAGTLDYFAQTESPVFTGSPQAPTQPAGTSDTTLATTAFVMALGGRFTKAPIPITTSQTYTPASATTYLYVKMVGAGAGGMPIGATSSTTCAVSAGGGAGAYLEFIIAKPTGSIAVTIGAGGGSNQQGGNTIFGAIATVSGGDIGTNLTGNSALVTGSGPGGAVVSVSSSALVLRSSNGSPSTPGFSVSISGGIGGNGGDSMMGAGGRGLPLGNGSNPGTGYGSGGGGGFEVAGSGTGIIAGGNGANGYVEVWEMIL